jgi:RNA polymerase sigma-70 factor, ECF subfamily
MRNPASNDSLATRESLFLRLKPDAPAREIAWREFYENYAPIMGGFARKMGAKPQDVSDVIQEVLVGFFAASPQFVYDPSLGRFRGYLKACVWRACQRKLGRQLSLQGRSLDEIDSGDPGVSQVWDDAWQNQTLQRALELVRERYAERPDKARTFRAFEMFAILDAPAEEVAKELNMSVDSVHQAKSRVSSAIRAEMKELDELTD